MKTTLMLATCLMAAIPLRGLANPSVLKGVDTISVAPTVVTDPNKVKNPSASSAVEQALRDALAAVGLRVGEAPMRTRILLDEFTAGNAAKRTLLGFGSGRSTVLGRLVIERVDPVSDGPALATVRIKTRGRLMFSTYQGDDTQLRHAVGEFYERLAEEIARLR